MKCVICLSITIVAAAIYFAVPAARAAEKRESMSSQQEMHEKMDMMEFVFVKGGCFQMGSNDGESDEEPVHEVCVSDFAIGKYEVTQGQWQAVMGSNPSRFSSCSPDCPVEAVGWNDVKEFIKKLNGLTGKNYRLPTEAEWEYACRSGGKKEKYSGTNDDGSLTDYAWYYENSGNKTHKVGTKKPNGLGIYDMIGNVDEWVEDTYSETAYSSHSRNNPINTGGSDRVVRGGSWGSNEPRFVRAADRCDLWPECGSGYVGFRLARTP